MVITKENFAQEVQQHKGLMVVDFWATWCGPCQMLAPELEALQKKVPSLAIGKINVDEQRELAMAFKVESIPMLYLFKDGEPVDVSIGYKECGQLEAWVKQHE